MQLCEHHEQVVQLVRLHGIDAPELDQTFQWRGQQIACGTMSLAALEALIAGVKVCCEVIERDRLVAQVFSPNGVDVGRRVVLAGWALAYRRYSTDYVATEDEARKAKRGMWRGSFMKPWVAGIVTGHAGTLNLDTAGRPSRLSRNPPVPRSIILAERPE